MSVHKRNKNITFSNGAWVVSCETLLVFVAFGFVGQVMLKISLKDVLQFHKCRKREYQFQVEESTLSKAQYS